MSDQPNFLSEYAIGVLEIGLEIRLQTMIEPGKAGPDLEFWVAPEQATSFAQSILEAVHEWKKTRRH